MAPRRGPSPREHPRYERLLPLAQAWPEEDQRNQHGCDCGKVAEDGYHAHPGDSSADAMLDWRTDRLAFRARSQDKACLVGGS